MSTTDDFDRIAGAWLAGGPAELSDRVLDAALDEVHLTRQRRRPAAPWRTTRMSTSMRLAAAIAIVAVVGFGAMTVFRDGISAPVTGSSPGQPVGTAASSAIAPRATASPMPFVDNVSGVPAGRYVWAGGPLPLSFDVPATSVGIWTAVTHPGGFSLTLEGVNGPFSLSMWSRFSDVFPDLCGRQIIQSPTVSEVFDALRHNPDLVASAESAGSIGGLPSMSVRLDVRADLPSTCSTRRSEATPPGSYWYNVANNGKGGGHLALNSGGTTLADRVDMGSTGLLIAVNFWGTDGFATNLPTVTTILDSVRVEAASP